MTEERSFTPHIARQRWEEVITNQNLHCEIKQITPHQPSTFLCHLFNIDHHKITHGIGKGLEQVQSELSAKYESLEHHTGSFFGANQNYFDWFTLHELESRHQPLLYSEIPEVFFSKKCRHAKTPWIELQSELTNQHYFLPLVLKDPFYMKKPDSNDEMNYHTMNICATNNGTAIGCNKTEALIHSLTELIERDALSLFLLRTEVSPFLR